MAFVTTEERVDRLEAVLGQFMTEMAVINRNADERNKAAEERMARLQAEMLAFKNEMLVFKDEMGAFKDEMLVFKDEMLVFKDEMLAFKNEMGAFKDEMRVFKDEMGAFKDEMRVFKDEMGAFKDEMLAFKNEMGAFKNEMGAFKNEMGAFKDEMRVFKDETRESRRELNKQWGELANKLGTIMEDIVAPNLRRLAVEHFGFPTIEDFMLRRSRRHGGRMTEFDALVVGPTMIILGEAKSSPSLEAAEAFATKAGRFFDFFPEYQGRRLIPILGSWSIPDEVIERLTARGVYALRMGEDTMELANAAALEGR